MLLIRTVDPSFDAPRNVTSEAALHTGSGSTRSHSDTDSSRVVVAFSRT